MRWTCARCGEEHEGLPLDVSVDAPAHWHALSPAERERSALGEDVCTVDDREGRFFYVRGTLEIPVREYGQSFAYGVWSSLSEASFERVLELWDDPRQEGATYFGWLSNSLPGYPETLNLRAEVETRHGGLRPAIRLEPSDHPLAVEQREGITLARVLEIVELGRHPDD